MGTMTRRNVYRKGISLTGAAASYVGPGDLETFTVFYGLRGYNAAYSTGSNPAVDIADGSLANAATINILSSGALDLATLDAWIVAHGSTVKVTKWYDQTGGANHLAPDTSQAARCPTLSRDAFGTGLSAIVTDHNVGNQMMQSANAITLAQPYSASLVCFKNGVQFQTIFLAKANNFVAYFRNQASQFGITAQTADFDVTCSDDANHIIHACWNGASSIVKIDSGADQTTNVGSIGSVGFSSEKINFCGTSSGFATGSDCCDGKFGAFGLLSGALDSTRRTNLYNNQHNYWGI